VVIALQKETGGLWYGSSISEVLSLDPWLGYVSENGEKMSWRICDFCMYIDLAALCQMKTFPI
jgi:hypothetical protein